MVRNMRLQKRLEKGGQSTFERLATPADNSRFDKQYKQLIDLDVDVIELLCKEEISPIVPVTETEVIAALKKLNNNKAVDIMGLTSEHLKLAGQEVYKFLTSFLNYLIASKSIASVLKEGILIPIFRKGDPSNPGNYRGITVTPVILKILEHVINARHNKIYQDT